MSLSITCPSDETRLSTAQIRRERGYSLTDLAETCGLTELEIARIEAGEAVAVPYLLRIAAALRIPADCLREFPGI